MERQTHLLSRELIDPVGQLHVELRVDQQLVVLNE